MSGKAAGERDREKAEQLVDKNWHDAQKHDGDMQELQLAYTMVTWKTVNMQVDRLECDNSEQQQVMQAQECDLVHWKAQVEGHHAKMEEIKHELSVWWKEEHDELAIVQYAQAEVETLCDQPALQEDKVAQLHKAPTMSHSTSLHRASSRPSLRRCSALHDSSMSWTSLSPTPISVNSRHGCLIHRCKHTHSSGASQH